MNNFNQKLAERLRQQNEMTENEKEKAMHTIIGYDLASKESGTAIVDYKIIDGKLTIVGTRIMREC